MGDGSKQLCKDVEFYHTKSHDAIETLVPILQKDPRFSCHKQIEYVQSLLIHMKAELQEGEDDDTLLIDSNS